MAHTFEEIVEKQRTADQAHARVRRIQEAFGPPTTVVWTKDQHREWETAWRAWRDLARQVQGEVTLHARATDTPRNEVESQVKHAARHAEPPG